MSQPRPERDEYDDIAEVDLPDGSAEDAAMAAHIVMERASFPPRRPALTFASGRRFVARRVPLLRSSFGSAILLGLRFLQARFISVWGLIIAAALCPPFVFAAFAVFAAAVNFVSTASLLRLEVVFFQTSDRKKLGLAVRLASLVGVAFLGLSALVLLTLALAGRVAPAVAFVFLLSLVGRTMLRLLWAEATAEGDFRAIGNSNVVQAVIQPVLMLLLIFLFGPKALALFLADAVGHLLAAAYLLRRRARALLPLLLPALWSLASLREAAHRWRGVAIVLLPSALLSYGFAIAPILALPYASNTLLAAHVALAMRLLDMPAQMFGTVAVPLTLNRLRAYTGTRRRFWMKLMTLALMAAAAALFAGIGSVAWFADGFLDSTRWAGVGEAVAVLSIFYAASTLVGPLQEIATLSRHALGQLAINAVSLVVIIAVMLGFGHLSLALLYALGAVSVGRTLLYLAFIWLSRDDAGEPPYGMAAAA
ncbi:hypothetical protein [Bosea sp. (in: a-proteobacteria)]|uniref:hypothetical protein n=1 Tax=Bosea sp. (in: a-proteobacteria) TaxID=1871050 RepID=UPI0012110F0C|nr:hypothetical protein [Bosea sp. (in: a-proteobacteria)]TAJ28641.1 MAG: hypothetical protein EPO59_18025 [Bosea sp. (in: a-proteobacteria)]